jgi:hypothetical protein
MKFTGLGFVLVTLFVCSLLSLYPITVAAERSLAIRQKLKTAPRIDPQSTTGREIHSYLTDHLRTSLPESYGSLSPSDVIVDTIHRLDSVWGACIYAVSVRFRGASSTTPVDAMVFCGATEHSFKGVSLDSFPILHPASL